MLSSADKVAGQGVGSAYLELIKLLREDGKDYFDVYINKGTKFDILHAHTVDPINYIKLKMTKGKKVVYVHFLPTTLDGSIKLPKLFSLFIFEFPKNPVRKRLDTEVHLVPLRHLSEPRERYHLGGSNLGCKTQVIIHPNSFLQQSN